MGPRLVVEHQDPPKESKKPSSGAGLLLMHPVSLTTQNEQPIASTDEGHGQESIILMPPFVEVPKVNSHDGLADRGRGEGHAD